MKNTLNELTTILSHKAEHKYNVTKVLTTYLTDCCPASEWRTLSSHILPQFKHAFGVELEAGGNGVTFMVGSMADRVLHVVEQACGIRHKYVLYAVLFDGTERRVCLLTIGGEGQADTALEIRGLAVPLY